MAPLRTGAARIALLAEARRDWKLGLRVQPVGPTYSRKHVLRGRALAAFGEPFEVASLRAGYERDERGPVRNLTATIQERLERLTLKTARMPEPVDVAERLYARQKRLAGWAGAGADGGAAASPPASVCTGPPVVARDRPCASAGAACRRPALPAAADALRGQGGGDVPRRYKRTTVLRYAARQLFMLLLVLPVALTGMVLWLPPYDFTRYVAPVSARSSTKSPPTSWARRSWPSRAGSSS